MNSRQFFIPPNPHQTVMHFRQFFTPPNPHQTVMLNSFQHLILFSSFVMPNSFRHLGYKLINRNNEILKQVQDDIFFFRHFGANLKSPLDKVALLLDGMPVKPENDIKSGHKQKLQNKCPKRSSLNAGGIFRHKPYEARRTPEGVRTVKIF